MVVESKSDNRILADNICQVMNSRTIMDYSPPALFRSIINHIVITSLLFIVFFLFFVHIFTSFQIWNPDNLDTLITAAFAVGATLLLILIPSCSLLCCTPGGMVTLASFGGKFSDPWADDYTKRVSRRKRFRVFFIVIFILLLVVTILISIDVSKISIGGMLGSLATAVSVAIGLYIGIWYSEIAIRKKIQNNKITKAREEFIRLEKLLLTDSHTSLQKDLALDDDRFLILSLSQPSRIFMYYTVVSGIMNWSKFTEAEVQVLKDSFYFILFQPELQPIDIQVKLGALLSNDLPKYSLSEKVYFIRFLVKYIDDIRLSQYFKMDYLYVYKRLSKELKQCQYDTSSIV